MTNKQDKKIRTSITIDPALLNQVRALADNGTWRSVSHFIEAAVCTFLATQPVENPEDTNGNV
jgi:Arc/MetJ-type ribon-helix-helix transcriptional regulator